MQRWIDYDKFTIYEFLKNNKKFSRDFVIDNNKHFRLRCLFMLFSIMAIIYLIGLLFLYIWILIFYYSLYVIYCHGLSFEIWERELQKYFTHFDSSNKNSVEKNNKRHLIWKQNHWAVGYILILNANNWNERFLFKTIIFIRFISLIKK